MRFQVIMPGKLRSAPMQALWDDYAARCRRLGGRLRLDFVPKATPRQGETQSGIEREAEAMVARLASPQSKVIALTERGEMFDSLGFARKLGRLRDAGAADVTFLVGSADGLGKHALEAAHLKMSLSRLTLPHELVLPVLAEQIYRALSILAGTPYHRD